jgi:putative transposase
MARFRSFQYVLQPTARQARALEHLLAVQCEAYNAALEERREAWKKGIRVTRFDQFAQLKDLHEARPDFLQYGVTVARGTLTRLDRAFSAFFRRVGAGQQPGYPASGPGVASTPLPGRTRKGGSCKRTSVASTFRASAT